MHEFLDTKALKNLAHALGVDASDTLTQLTDLFKKNCQKKITLMRKEAELDDYTEVAHGAHALKGSAANLSIVTLKEKFEQIESQAKAGHKENIFSLLEEIEQLLPLVIERLQQFITDLPR